MVVAQPRLPRGRGHKHRAPAQSLGPVIAEHAPVFQRLFGRPGRFGIGIGHAVLVKNFLIVIHDIRSDVFRHAVQRTAAHRLAVITVTVENGRPDFIQIDQIAVLHIFGEVHHHARRNPLPEIAVRHQEHVGHVRRSYDAVELRFIAADDAHIHLDMAFLFLFFAAVFVVFVHFGVVFFLKRRAHLAHEVCFRRAAVVPMAQRDDDRVAVRRHVRHRRQKRRSHTDNNQCNGRNPRRELLYRQNTKHPSPPYFLSLSRFLPVRLCR